MYAYNNADEMTSYAEGQASGSTCGTPPAASAILLTYDARGRLLTTNYPSTTPDITRTYDANGNLLTINRGGANWTYAYNSVDLPGSETLVIDARTYAITNTYDNNERLTQRKFPSGNTYAYTNDGLGRPTALKQGTTTYASAIGWHPNGKLSALTRGNGDVFTQQLNARQLTAFIGSNIGDDLNYTYDANGRVTVINAVANNAWDRTFTYDGAGRLKTAAGPWGSGSYLYDPLSNLTKKTLGSRVVDIETNSLNRVYRVKDTAVSANWRTYTHDARGNVTNDGSHGFTYDFANQPTAISGADTGTYSYDGNLKRVKQVVGGQTLYSIYDRSGALLTRDNATTATKTDYLAVAGQTFVRVRNNVASYPMNDHLGTALAVAAQNGSIPAAQTYNTTPFGEAYGAYSPGDTNEQGYTGHIEDATGLTYMQARYYDPIIGRFLATDPVGYLDQLNLYAYVANDPVNNVDYTGLYGQGTGWDEKSWKKFDRAQQQAANRMEKRADKLEANAAKLDSKGKEGGDNLRTAASNLRGGADALRSDGSDGKIANAVSAENWTKDKTVAGYVNGAGGNVMTVNLGHDAFKVGGTAFNRVLTHESLHTAGLSDWTRGARAYCCSGVEKYLNHYQSLTPEEQVRNPDYLMEMVW